MSNQFIAKNGRYAVWIYDLGGDEGWKVGANFEDAGFMTADETRAAANAMNDAALEADKRNADPRWDLSLLKDTPGLADLRRTMDMFDKATAKHSMGIPLRELFGLKPEAEPAAQLLLEGARVSAPKIPNRPPSIQATALLRNEVMRRVPRGYMFRVCILAFRPRGLR